MEFVSVEFAEGPLGVTLGLDDDGTISVNGIQEGTQASSLDIAVNDELHSIHNGSLKDSRQVRFTRESWKVLIEELKSLPRPLQLTFRRAHDLNAIADETLGMEVKEEGLLAQAENEGDLQQTDGDDEEIISFKEQISTPSVTSDSSNSPKKTPPPKPSKPIIESTKSPQKAIVLLDDLLDSMVVQRKKDSFLSKAAESLVGSNHSFLAPSEFVVNGVLQTPRSLVGGSSCKLVKDGEVNVSVPSTLWESTSKRHLFLFEDRLLISSTKCKKTANKHSILNVIELNTSKIYDHASLNELKFELRTPHGVLEVLVSSAEEREAWVMSIFQSLCSCVSAPGQQALGWRHQYMLGTLHSFIIARDEEKLKELLSAMMEKNDPSLLQSAVNALDIDGMSPLHYACALRLRSIIKLLISVGADPLIGDAQGLSSIHWSALQLDEVTLSYLCSSRSIANIDILDNAGRTPLFLACVEGKGVNGRTDPASLSRCLTCLLALGADPNYGQINGNNAVQYLAGSWQHIPLEVLVKGGGDINNVENDDGYNALHYAAAALPIKRALGEGVRRLSHHAGKVCGGKEDDNEDVEVNEKADDSSKEEATKNQARAKTTSTSTDTRDFHLSFDLAEIDDGFEEPIASQGVDTILSLVKGGAYLNCLTRSGLSSLQLLSQSRSIWDEEFEEAVSVLLKHGARLDSSMIELHQELNSACSSFEVDDLIGKWSELGILDGDDLRLRLSSIDSTGGSLSPVHFETSPASNNSNGGEHTTSPASIGSNPSTKECQLCGFVYTLFTRRHTCRICEVGCCDECSKKRIIVNYKETRACDGCYNKTIFKTWHSEHEDRERAAIKVISTTTGANNIFRQNNDIAPETKRKLLFGTPTEDAGREGRGDAVADTANTLREVGQALNERGERLERLDEKSQELSNAAAGFADMARLLNKQQKSSWW